MLEIKSHKTKAGNGSYRNSFGAIVFQASQSNVHANIIRKNPVDYSRIKDIVKKYKSIGTSTGNVPQENWVLIGINFDFNKATIKPESIPILYNTAEILLKNPDVKVEIQGHTDNIGSDRYNQKLSLQRAETVKNFLIAKGVASDRLTTVGFGKTKMLMDNKSEQGRGLNRRIELKIIK